MRPELHGRFQLVYFAADASVTSAESAAAEDRAGDYRVAGGPRGAQKLTRRILLPMPAPLPGRSACCRMSASAADCGQPAS